MRVSLENDPQAVARHLAQCIERDPDRLGGEPIFRGIRVPVKSLFDHLIAGDSLETFLDDFPGVTREQVQTVLDLAEIHLLGEEGEREGKREIGGRKTEKGRTGMIIQNAKELEVYAFRWKASQSPHGGLPIGAIICGTRSPFQFSTTATT
jgi:uncharacterized protein (DUF433 family)